MKLLTEEQLETYGNDIGLLLNIPKNRKRLWKTHYGDKTNAGLTRAILNIAHIMDNQGRL
jgi:hypothetical protein